MDKKISTLLDNLNNLIEILCFEEEIKLNEMIKNFDDEEKEDDFYENRIIEREKNEIDRVNKEFPKFMNIKSKDIISNFRDSNKYSKVNLHNLEEISPMFTQKYNVDISFLYEIYKLKLPLWVSFKEKLLRRESFI